MPKFYVTSGDMQQIVNADDASEAMRLAVLRTWGPFDQWPEAAETTPELAKIVGTSETGFGVINDNDLFKLTRRVLDEIAIDNGYEPVPEDEDEDEEQSENPERLSDSYEI